MHWWNRMAVGGRRTPRLRTTRGEPALLDGEIATAQENIAPGATGRVELRGSMWTARNKSRATLVSGTRARVEKTEGLLVHVRSVADVEARAKHRRGARAPRAD